MACLPMASALLVPYPNGESALPSSQLMTGYMSFLTIERWFSFWPGVPQSTTDLRPPMPHGRFNRNSGRNHWSPHLYVPARSCSDRLDLACRRPPRACRPAMAGCTIKHDGFRLMARRDGGRLALDPMDLVMHMEGFADHTRLHFSVQQGDRVYTLSVRETPDEIHRRAPLLAG